MYVALDPRDCVTCEPPGYCNCAKDEQCSYTQQTCTQCAQMVCTKVGGGTNKGAIAGGVVGGLVALAIIVGAYLWWRRRHARRASAYLEQQQMMDESDKAYSIHSVNTAQARGSNVIPIAYIPGVSEQQRGSVATSDYRASLPDFVMAVHGQPSLVEIGSKSQAEQRSSLYDGLGLEELAGLADTTEAGANSGKSMVTIPEEDETGVAHRAVGGVPTMRTYDPRVIDAPPRVDPRKTPRNSQYPTRHSSARYSRNSSVREYNMNIPEEALYYYNNLDERDE